MSDLPQPLTPPDCDLRGLEWMPFYGHRLFASEFDAYVSDAGFRAALNLCWAAWNQVPAASLPDDDIALCRLAGHGRSLKRWRAIRHEAMWHFVLCADGRRYHETLAPLALQAWDRRQKDRQRKERWKERGRNASDDAAGTRDRTGHDTTGEETNGDDSLRMAAQPPSAGRGRRGGPGLRQVRAGDLGLQASIRPGAAGAAVKRRKPQDRADGDMVRWLMSEHGVTGDEAWGVVWAARDPEDKDHARSARLLEGISREHRLGWFADEEPA